MVDRILARSEGNAFFAEAESRPRPSRPTSPCPRPWPTSSLERIEALPELAQEVLKVAAVAGRRVGHQLLVAASGRPEAEVEQGLRDAIAGQVLVASAATESYQFRHALLQEAVYGDLLPGEQPGPATYAHLLAAADDQTGSGSAAELAWRCLASHDLPGGLAALVQGSRRGGQRVRPSEAYTSPRALGLEPGAGRRGRGQHRPGRALPIRAAAAASDAPASSGRRSASPGRPSRPSTSRPSRCGRPRSPRAPRRLPARRRWSCRGSTRRCGPRPARPSTWSPSGPDPAAGPGSGGHGPRPLQVTRRPTGARRWGEEALEVARAAGSDADEARALIILTFLELRFGDEATARALLQDADVRAAAAGNQALELVARHGLGLFELDLGNLEAACAAFDQAVELADRSGLIWSGYGIDSQVLRCIAHYLVRSRDQAERMAATADERRPAVSAAALYVEVGRGLPAAAERLARLAPYLEADPYVAYLAGGAEADLAHAGRATWAVQRAGPGHLATAGGGRRALGAQRLAGRPGPGRRGRPGRAGPGRGRPGRRQGTRGRPGPAGAGPGGAAAGPRPGPPGRPGGAGLAKGRAGVGPGRRPARPGPLVGRGRRLRLRLPVRGGPGAAGGWPRRC